MLLCVDFVLLCALPVGMRCVFVDYISTNLLEHVDIPFVVELGTCDVWCRRAELLL